MAVQDGDDTRLLTVAEAARRLSLGLSLTYRLVLDGRLRSVKIGRCRRVPAREIEDFIGRQLQAARD